MTQKDLASLSISFVLGAAFAFLFLPTRHSICIDHDPQRNIEIYRRNRVTGEKVTIFVMWDTNAAPGPH